MSIFNGLGAFAGGVAQGVGLRNKIDQIKHDREKREEQKRIDKEIAAAGTKAWDFGEEKDQESIKTNIPLENNNQFGLGAVDYIGGDSYVPVQGDDVTKGMGNYADGGLVQDPKSTVSMVNAASGLSAAQQSPVPKKVNEGQRLSRMFNAMRDKAFELGRPDLAKDYQMAGFQIRDRMYKENITNAQRAYEMTGDIGGFVKAYNEAIDDGATVDGYEKTDSGYKLRINNNGNVIEREFAPDQIRNMVMTFNDPSARYAAEMQSIDARNKKTFETNEEIRKSKAIEDGKVHSIGLDSVLIKGDGTKIHDGSANRPTFKNEQEVLFAASKPDHPNHAEAKKMLELEVGQKSRVAAAGRAPREEPLEKIAYRDWSSKPENKGKGISDYMKEKASWGKAPEYDSVTESTTQFDGASEKKISTTKKVPREKPGEKPAKKPFTIDKYL